MALEQNIKFLLDFTGGESLDALTKKVEAFNAVLAGDAMKTMQQFGELMKQIGNDPKNIIENQKAIQSLEKTQQSYQKTLQETLKTQKLKDDSDKKSEDAAKKGIVLTNEQIAQNQINAQSKRDAIALAKAEILAVDGTVRSIRQLEAANKSLAARRDIEAIATGGVSANVKALNEQINANNKIIQENSDKFKQQKMNVGNYTDSIKKAFEGTGELGEGISRYMNIVTLIIDKLELFTVAVEASTVALEGEAIAAEGTAIALDTEAEATVAAEVATKGFTEALATNPFVLAAIAIVALAKVIYDNATATQDARDAVDAWEESVKEAAKWVDVLGDKTEDYRKKIYELLRAEQTLNENRIASIVTIQKLRTEAEIARELAMDEKLNTVDRIQKLSDYIEKIKEVGKIEMEGAQKEADLKEKRAELNPGGYDTELVRAAEEAKKKVLEIEAEVASGNRRVEKQRSAIIEKDIDDRLKLLQDAQKEEIELIDTFSLSKTEHILKQAEKDTALNELETKQKIDNLIIQQKKLGDIDTNGINRRAQFLREREDLQKLGDAKEIEIDEKKFQELQAIDNAYKEKIKESTLKFNVEMEKLQIEYAKIQQEIVKQNFANRLSEIDYEISQEKLKRHFSKVETLTQQHHDITKDGIIESNTNSKNEAEQAANNDEQAVRDKYDKLKTEEDKAALDANMSEEENKARHILRKKQEADEIIQIEKNKNDKIKLLNDKAKGELEKNDQDLLNKEKEIAELRLSAHLKIEEEITKGIVDAINSREAMQQAADQRSIDMHVRTMDVQAKLAAGGLENTLGAEQAAFAQAEEKKLQDAKKAAKAKEAVELGSQLLKLVTTKIDKGESGLQALAESGAEVALIKLAANAIVGAFAGGVEGFQGAGTETSDSNLVRISHEESIVTAKGTKENPGLVTAMNKGVVDEYFSNKISDDTIFKRQNESFEKSILYPMRAVNDDRIVSQLAKNNKLLERIAAKPASKASLGRLGEWTEEIHLQNMKQIIRHKNDISFR